LLVLPKIYDVGGHYDGELPASISDCQDKFQKHDRKVETLLDRVTSIEIHPFKDLYYLQPWYFDKYLLIDESGKCRGTIFHIRTVDTITLEKLKNKYSDIPDFHPPSEIFSKREWDILFYKIQGYSA